MTNLARSYAYDLPANPPIEQPTSPERHLQSLPITEDPESSQKPHFTASQTVQIGDKIKAVDVALTDEEALLVSAIRQRFPVTQRLYPAHVLAVIHGRAQQTVLNYSRGGEWDPHAPPIPLNQAYFASRAGELLLQFGVTVYENNRPA